MSFQTRQTFVDLLNTSEVLRAFCPFFSINSCANITLTQQKVHNEIVKL